MTMFALEDLKLDKVSKRQIARYSQMPDFQKSELGFYNNTHFFFPYSTNKSFGYNSEKLNALEKFKEHFKEILYAKDKNTFFKSIGYTIHYLQDASVPVHTEAGGIIHKIFKYRTHTNFEKHPIYGATAKLDLLIKNHKEETKPHKSFLDLFMDTASFAQKPEYKVTRFNKDKWTNIQQDCFSKGVNSTKEFLLTIFKLKDCFLQN